MSTIYFIVFILFCVYLVWTWNSTKEFGAINIRISYLIIGTVFITFITFLLFWISKIGVEYPKPEMVGQVRKIILLIFIPINGFMILIQAANIIGRVKNGNISNEDVQKRVKFLIIFFIAMIILECIYFKNIQNGIISVINAK